MKFGVREICNVVFKATTERKIGETTFKKGAPVLYFDSLKTSTMEQAVTTVYAQGGRGNTRLIAWDGEKTLTFTMEDALISEMGLAILASAKLYKASGTNVLLVHVTETIAAENNGGLKVTKKTASRKTDGDSTVEFFALPLDDNGEVSGDPIKVDIDPTTGVVTAAEEGDTLDGNTYLVDYYSEKTEDAYQIDIEPQNFGGNFYIEADTLFRDTLGTDHAAQFIIPNGKIQSNFTLSMASTGDPSTFTFTVDAFPGYINGDKTKKVMSAIQVISGELDDIVDDAAGDFDNVSASGEEEEGL